ncbi:hypothetical protein MD484_g6604, partial [Candolleomyces efflorescens]
MISSNACIVSASLAYHADILSTIVKHVPWKSLIQWYAWDKVAADLVLPEIRSRVFSEVGAFVPADNVLELFEVIGGSDGLICGSVARRVLLPYWPVEDDGQPLKATPCPNDLNILTAADRSELLFNFFQELNYQYSIESPSPLYEAYVTKLEVFTLTRDNGEVSRVTVSLCKNGPLSALLGSPTTAEMNAITYDAIFSFFPRLTYANEALVMSRVTDAGTSHDQLRAGGGVRLYTDNAHWTKPCGPYCPMKRRKTFDDPGVARYRWSPLQNDLNEYNEWGRKILNEPSRMWSTDRDMMYTAMEKWRVLDSPMCTKPHIVPVPVRKVRGNISTINDVFSRVHVNVWTPESSTYYVTESLVIEGGMGTYSAVEEPYKYTLFRSNHPFDRFNRLIRSIAGGRGLRITGPLIVVKTDQSGAVCDVTQAEIYHIERIIVHTLAVAGFANPAPRANIDTFDLDYMSDPDIVV